MPPLLVLFCFFFAAQAGASAPYPSITVLSGQDCFQSARDRGQEGTPFRPFENWGKDSENPHHPVLKSWTVPYGGGASLGIRKHPMINKIVYEWQSVTQCDIKIFYCIELDPEQINFLTTYKFIFDSQMKIAQKAFNLSDTPPLKERLKNMQKKICDFLRLDPSDHQEIYLNTLLTFIHDPSKS